MKLIATDLDGTLLNERGEVSEENAQAIKKAVSKGIKFVVATGRSYDAANKPLQDAGLSCPIICLNGANTYDSKKTLIRSVPMDNAVCQKILTTCEDAGMYIEIFTNQGGYSVSREYFMEVLVDIIKSINSDATEEDVRAYAEQRFQNEHVQFIDHFEPVLANPDVEIYKFLSFSFHKEVLKEVSDKLSAEDGVVITSSGHINLEFNHPDAQKGIALEMLANSMGISMEDVMALGDNFNDKSMLERAGRGVAMENAPEAIKTVCRYTTKSNDENGVAHAIEEMLKEMIIS
ncbi:hypothetical protein SAMN05421736_101724 [Evansella caseinilytica]|uniref:Cof subfamily protein (Haloacid dehalogenase superfamily)/HAD superfamily hydrolase (TIGR01484 family) n=1 Tax=Evansella caseinilytica TaxID=1503961 RepID=A0A1H3I6X4_9BACI|nr:Cof-type HAD-IIB family hydrolase [Evansella caseinilytica]SDY22959.1 hypothetical protein SAMN05421736_101724 [Evansella caseinilytica]